MNKINPGDNYPDTEGLCELKIYGAASAIGRKTAVLRKLYYVGIVLYKMELLA